MKHKPQYMNTILEYLKNKMRCFVYSLIFNLFSNNKIKKESIVLGIIIGYINPNATRSAVEYLVSDLDKNSIDLSMVLNGVLMSSYLIPNTEDSKEFCTVLSTVDPRNDRECKSIKTSFISKVIDITNYIEIDSLLNSLNILIKNNKKISNIAI